MESSERSPDIRKIVKLTNPEKLYAIEDRDGRSIPFEDASGSQMVGHYRDNATNSSEVLKIIRDEQGQVTGWHHEQVSLGVAERALEKFRDEHVKVIEDAQGKGNILRNLMQRAGVGTASALSSMLDAWSDKLKEMGQLKNSQRSLQTWNDTYRVQRQLVREVLKREEVSSEVITQIEAIYKTRSVNKAIEKGSVLFDLEKSEILKMVKAAIRYAKLLSDESAS